MRLDLLWFRHQRPPRPHVAEPTAYNYASIIDMSGIIAALDPGESIFSRMLAGHWVNRAEEVQVGQYFRHEGKWVKAYKVKRLRSEDWFTDDTWDVLITEPVALGTSHGKIEWLEDELFPRLGTVESSDNPMFRRGDKVQIIAGA